MVGSVNFFCQTNTVMSTYTDKTLHRFKQSKDLVILLHTIFCKKKDRERVLVLEIENNITRIPSFLQLGCKVEITIT